MQLFKLPIHYFYKDTDKYNVVYVMFPTGTPSTEVRSWPNNIITYKLSSNLTGKMSILLKKVKLYENLCF